MFIKGVLNCCKLQVISKSQKKLPNKFRFKGLFPQILTSGVVYKFQCGLCNESYQREYVTHLVVRSGEHIGISSLKYNRVQPRKDRTVCHHLLNYKILVFFVIRSTFQKRKPLYKERQTINESKHTFRPSICLNEFLSHCLLHHVAFFDQFLVILCNFLDLRKNCKFSFSVCETV